MIKGKITGLRAIEEQDLKRLLEWRNQPDYRVFFREYRELNMTNQLNWFEKVTYDDKTRMFSIIKLSTKELIGACGLCYIDWPNQSADFSIYIGEGGVYIDEEYAVDAAQVMIKYGFRELNLHRLWSEVYEIDEKKKKLFDSLGFIHEATHLSTHWTCGKWVDSWFYRLLDVDWKA